MHFAPHLPSAIRSIGLDLRTHSHDGKVFQSARLLATSVEIANSSSNNRKSQDVTATWFGEKNTYPSREGRAENAEKVACVPTTCFGTRLQSAPRLFGVSTGEAFTVRPAMRICGLCGFQGRSCRKRVWFIQIRCNSIIQSQTHALHWLQSQSKTLRT